MSGDNRALIGEAVTEYQSAKIECAKIEQQVEKVFLAYREAGSTMDRNRGTISEPRLEKGTIKFGYYDGRFSSADLLNEVDLRALLERRDAARGRLAAATKAMRELGITGIS